MFKYIVKRLLISIVILLGVSLIIYTLVRLLPVDYIERKYSAQLQQGQMTQEQVDEYKEMYGLGDNSFKGIVGGYFNWLSNVAKGNLGDSFKYEKPVARVITENMWISFAIAFIATILQFLIAIPLGITSATHQYTARDYIVTIFTMIGLALPTYFFAAIAIKIFAVDLGWLPTGGLVSGGASYAETFAGQMQRFGDILKHLILPISVSVILSIGGLMRYTRTNTLEVLNADYIRTARAKGAREARILFAHVLRNAIAPAIAYLGPAAAGLMTGSFVVETIFQIPGLGRFFISSALDNDYTMIMGCVMLYAVFILLFNLLSDIALAAVNPRIAGEMKK